MRSKRAILLVALVLASAVGVVAYLSQFGRQPKVESNEPKIESNGLYADEEIQRLAPYDIVAATKSARSILQMPCLPVVPSGSARPRAEVFCELGIDDSRIRDFRTVPADHVEFLWWQVSPSYDIACMTGNRRGRSEKTELTDPQRSVYGLRLVSRADVDLLSPFWYRPQ
jgi:hypothetical protein